MLVADDVDAEAYDAQVDQDEDHAKDVGHGLCGETEELLSRTQRHSLISQRTSLEDSKWQTDLFWHSRSISCNSIEVFLTTQKKNFNHCKTIVKIFCWFILLFVSFWSLFSDFLWTFVDTDISRTQC